MLPLPLLLLSHFQSVQLSNSWWQSTRVFVSRDFQARIFDGLFSVHAVKVKVKSLIMFYFTLYGTACLLKSLHPWDLGIYKRCLQIVPSHDYSRGIAHRKKYKSYTRLLYSSHYIRWWLSYIQYNKPTMVICCLFHSICWGFRRLQ